MRRLCYLFFAIFFVLYTLSITILASNDIDTFIDIENSYSSASQSPISESANDEVILTIDNNGEVAKKNISSYLSPDSVALKSYASLAAYTTALSKQSVSNDLTSSRSSNRVPSNPVDNRVGQIACRYNTDDNPDMDITYFGTASLQSYDILVSCAHCIWKPQYVGLPCDGWASEVTFYAGRTSDTSYAESADKVSMSISQSFVNNSSYTLDDEGNPVVSIAFNWDWSIIQIDQNLGGAYGWFGLHGCGTPETDLSIYTLGYPVDEAFGSQWKSTGTIDSFNDNRMHYSAYISSGNSGGPILNNSYLYGIATFSASNATGSWLYSGGTRIYDNLFALISGARDESEERWGS